MLNKSYQQDILLNMRNEFKNNIERFKNIVHTLNTDNAESKYIQSIFNLIMHNIDEFVWLLDKNLKIIFVTPSVKNIIGFTDKEFISNDISNITTPQSENIIKNAFNNIKIDYKKKLQNLPLNCGQPL